MDSNLVHELFNSSLGETGEQEGHSVIRTEDGGEWYADLVNPTDEQVEAHEKIVRAVNSHDALVEALKFVKANAIFPLGMAKGITGTDPWDIVDEALKLAEGKE